ncbi:tyrosine-type recombinase/integrase [Rickettsiales endosymbiont of Stachyamoeba lipophora]|uniref:tyrosine-type recombinase/integrase n=1 Tax=Rickettsiales endosymbiont of Stachyamoeba lipophora TaxID=2486578 RepID=UPI000F64B093|nr:site-specific integrase [Rickettsiales endosymbiont of Stachyamoeba lipophora]AZL16333.1 DUF4102 domain-containing protein [Rickettsiales endosymbiont of Stachyamoeba lipophora]
MSNAIKLTKKEIDKFQYNGGWDVRWDTEVTGFGVRVYESGKKSYILSYRVSGRKKLVVLGSTQVLTLDQARNMAKLHLAEVIKGNDPSESKGRGKKEVGFQEFCKIYIERHAKKHKKTWKEDQRKIEKHLLPIWKNMSLNSITKTDIMNLHIKIGDNTPYEANRTINLLSTLFELAKEWGYLDESYSNPTKYIKLYKEQKRDRWVSSEEMPNLIQAIEAETNLYARYAIWLYLLTGMRKSELLQVKWSDINFTRREIKLDDTKAGRVHYIPLSQPAVELISNIPRIDNNPYLLPGHVKGKHLINISKPWNRIRKNANLENVRLHDLRRTVGSWLAQSGKSLHLIGKVLNHSNQRTTAIYAHFARNDIEEALEEHGQKILKIYNNRKVDI